MKTVALSDGAMAICEWAAFIAPKRLMKSKEVNASWCFPSERNSARSCREGLVWNLALSVEVVEHSV